MEGEKGGGPPGTRTESSRRGNQANEMGFVSRELQAACVGSQSFARPRQRRPTFSFHKKQSPVNDAKILGSPQKKTHSLLIG